MTEPKKRIRCAIYTRKSTEEGLDMEFNSLDAQREAGESYITSQRHEGWTLVPEYYDDGGFSGGSMERPALQKLMRDIEKGLIDVVVVYKVDRLSRSLSDFAKLIDLFDKRNVSFVSVTQQFNTTTSMGRLAQHVDLAFSGVKVPGSLEPYTTLEIEHILPDTPTDELRAAWAAGNPDAVYDDYKTRLGNLTLLEKPHNIIAGNNFYTEKLKIYRDCNNYLTRSMAELATIGQNSSVSRINEKLAAFPTWDAAAIDKRHTLLMALAQDIWKTNAIDA